jgi:O-methyltransferase
VVKSLLNTPRVNRWASPDHAIGRRLLAARIGWQLATWRPGNDDEQQLKAAIARVAPPFTMVDLPRLRQLASLADLVHQRRIPGCIVECGTWKGGSLALIDWVMRRHGDRRELWGFDSFAGLPPPTDRDEDVVKKSFFRGWCTAAVSDVLEAFAAVGGPGEGIHLVEGWLADTLPASNTGPIALLNIDVDWYESVKLTLDVLFERVAAGGIVNVDDFGRWPGCDAAVLEFVSARGLNRSILTRTGPYGAWFVKP